MKAFRLNQPGEFELVELKKPQEIGTDEVLVKVQNMGVCGTDIHAFSGRQPFFSYPRILGHELAIEVLSLGENVNHLTVGDKCAVEPYLNCGECHACHSGKQNCCEKLSVLGVHEDGGMAEYLVIPQQKLHKSEKLAFEQLALVETLSIGAHAVDRAEIKANQRVLVIGAGSIGLTAICFALKNTSEVSVFDLNEYRIAHAEKSFDLDSIYTDSTSLPPNYFDVVIDCTGSQASMEAALKYVASGGALILVGLYQGDFSFFDPEFHRKEISLLSSRNSLPKNFKSIIADLEAGLIDTNIWFNNKVDFLDIPAFFGGLEQNKSLVKAIISF